MLAHVFESTKFKPSAKPKLSWGRPPPSPQMSSLAARGYYYKRHFFFSTDRPFVFQNLTGGRLVCYIWPSVWLVALVGRALGGSFEEPWFVWLYFWSGPNPGSDRPRRSELRFFLPCLGFFL